MHYNRMLVVALSVLMVACSTMRQMNDLSYRTVKDNFKLGDNVVIVDTQGERHNLKISRIVNDALYGYDEYDEEVSFSYAQISELQYKEFSGGKTAGASAAVVVIVLVIAAAMFAVTKEMFDGSNESD